MMKKGLVAVLTLAWLMPAYARVDAMQLRLLEPYSQDLRWDNIESMPAWVNGAKPEYDGDWAMHRVHLKPAQSVTFVLPAYESLRLYQPKQTLTAKELDVYLSDGTGLAVKQVLQTSTDEHSLVLSPNAMAPMLVHVTRPTTAKKAFDVALFVSRRVPIADIAPYRHLIWSTTNWCLLAQQAFALPELYNQLNAGEKQRFEVSGPARIALKNRLYYVQSASALVQDYRIAYSLDNGNAQELNFSTSVETSRVVTVNSDIVVVGREEQAYLEIPAGEHQLILQSDRDLYLQLVAQTEHDYLLPSLNQPRLPVEDIRRQGLLATSELMLKDQAAKQLARDNSHQDSGMVASNLLREAALKRKDYPEGLVEAEQLRGFRTFYRDLLPSKKASTSPQFMAYFLDVALQPVALPRSNAILADQHISNAITRIDHGYFTQLDKTAVNEYQLPPQQTAGQLRLAVDKRHCKTSLLHLQIDNQAPKEFWLRCEQDQAQQNFTRALAESAIVRLQQQDNSFNVTLDAVFSIYNSPAAPLIPTAVYELPYTKDTKSLTLWQTGQTQVPIALQYRVSKPFSFSEQSYLARLRFPNEPQLQNELLGLQRLLQSEYRLYQSGLATYPESTVTEDKQIVASETAAAQKQEQQQHWLEALEHWGKVVNAANGLTHQQAQLAQANALSKLGETYLAESLRKYLSLHAQSSVAEAAVQQLAAQYLAQNDNTALLTLAAAMHIHRPTAAHQQLLLQALLKNNEYYFVLLAGLTAESPPLDALLTAAYQLSWWESYQTLHAKLPAGQRAFWQGLKQQHIGDVASALQTWSIPELKNWHDYLQQGRQLREDLTHATHKNAVALYGAWATWQQQNPSAKVWQNALWLTTDYAGSDSYYALERDVYSHALRATTERPVTLSILGPATLNIQFRPLHPANKPDSALDGWLDISDNQIISRYPYSNNQPAQGLRVIGADTLQLGSMVTLEYQVGQGRHEIKLNSAEAPLSITLQEQRPEFPLTILPPLQANTFAEMSVMNREQQRTKQMNNVNWRHIWR